MAAPLAVLLLSFSSLERDLRLKNLKRLLGFLGGGDAAVVGEVKTAGGTGGYSCCWPFVAGGGLLLSASPLLLLGGGGMYITRGMRSTKDLDSLPISGLIIPGF